MAAVQYWCIFIVLNGFDELIANSFEEIPEFQRPNNMTRPHFHFAHTVRLAQRIWAEKSDLSTVLKMFWFAITQFEFKYYMVWSLNQTNMGKNFIKIHLSGCQLEWFILMNEFNFFSWYSKIKPSWINKSSEHESIFWLQSQVVPCIWEQVMIFSKIFFHNKVLLPSWYFFHCGTVQKDILDINWMKGFWFVRKWQIIQSPFAEG